VHQSSMEAMAGFVDQYLADRRGTPLRVLDVGSMNVNGTYRTLFEQPGWSYTGLDLEPGPGVDLVLTSTHDWRSVPSDSYDIVITGQAFEHMEFPWITVLHVTRALAPGGLLCLIVPSGGEEHRYPVDCWRFYPDGVAALARWGDLEPLSTTTAWPGTATYPDESERWADTVLVARKPIVHSPVRRTFGNLKRAVLVRLMAAQGARRRSV
jgi:hypothetical protein